MKKKRIVIMPFIIAIIFIIGGCATTGQVREGPPETGQTVITDIKVMDNVVEITASGPFIYTLYKPSDPYRVVVDMPDVNTGRYKDRISSDKAGITEVIPAQVEAPRLTAKIEILLQSPSNIEPAYKDSVLTLRVKGAPAEAKSGGVEPVKDEKVEVKELKKEEIPEPEPKIGAIVKAEETKPPKRAQKTLDTGNSGAAIEIKGPEASIEGKYTGQKISLDFQDTDIVPIFRLLSDISGYNIVVSPDVKGKLTLKLINVPWDQALDLILKTFSLGQSIEGNIIRIAPLAVFAKESDERAKAKEAEVRAEELETRFFSINYADVSLVESAIKGSKILTSRGNISVDKRTSSMVIKDAASVFPQVESLLATLDKPTQQVMIEARIVEVNTSAERDLGIQWGLSLQTPNTLTSFGGLTGLNTGSFTGGNYLVDLPSGSAAGEGAGFTFGIINPAKTMGLDFQLSAIQKVGKGKIVSNPKIMTVDNGKALISQGDSIPIKKLTAEGTVSTEFKDYTLSLTVTPHITPDKSIAMAIETKKEEPDWTRVSSEGTPASKKREANTSVIIKDGETVVIGGVFKTSNQDSDSGVPGLMNIPVLGWLFKKNKVTDETSEMLIFITPRIIQKP